MGIDPNTTHLKEQDEADPEFQQVATNYVGPTQWYYTHDEKHNVTQLFCWIQKVGCTHFKEVYRRICALKQREKEHEDDVSSSSSSKYKCRLPLVHRTWIRNYSRLLIRPEIHKMMFYREPMTRFLSGYLDKCRGSNRHYCKLVFGSENRTFHEAVHLLKDMDPNRLDGHFGPQTKHCGGLDRNRVTTLFDIVEELTEDPQSTRESMKKMLQYSFVGMTDEEFDSIYPQGKSAHAANAASQLEKYYNKSDNPQLIGILVNYFLEDYLAFNIKPRKFAQEALLDLKATEDPYALGDENMIKLGILTRTEQQSTEQVEILPDPAVTTISSRRESYIFYYGSSRSIQGLRQPAAVYYLLFAIMLRLMLVVHQ